MALSVAQFRYDLLIGYGILHGTWTYASLYIPPLLQYGTGKPLNLSLFGSARFGSAVRCEQVDTSLVGDGVGVSHDVIEGLWSPMFNFYHSCEFRRAQLVEVTENQSECGGTVWLLSVIAHLGI